MTIATGEVSPLLATLRRHRVRFIVVGGVAAVIEGAPVTTFDLDVVHDRTPANVRRLVAALRALGATYRTRPELRRMPTVAELTGSGHHLLVTRHGPLDVLGAIGRDRDFGRLKPRTKRRKLGAFFVAVLDLATQIAVKEELGFEKDRLMLPVLRETLRLSRARRPRRKR
jgi:hypothetical protein